MGYRDSEEYKERERERKRLYGLKRKAEKEAERAGKPKPKPAKAKATKPKPAKPANVGRKAKPTAKPRKKADRPKSLLDVAADILKGSKGQPGWHPQIIVNTAIAHGLWKPGKGKTPAATLWKNILGEIKSKGRKSRFVKSGKGEFKFNEKLRDRK
jgi:hypothetical protein